MGLAFSCRQFLALGLLGLTVTGCSPRSTASPAAPEFELKDLSGKTVSLEQFRGHPVLLDFWATWCGPCQISIPMVQQFYMRHQKDGLVVLGMNVNEDPAEVPAFVEHFQMTYPVLLAGASSAGNDYQVEGIPLFVFVDREGRIVRRFVGFSRDMPEAWEAELQDLLAAH